MPVEFVHTEPDDAAPPDPAPPPRHRTLLVRALVVALIVAAVAAWALTRTDPAPARHRPTAVPAPTSRMSTPSILPAQLMICRAAVRPPDLLAAVRRFVHHVVVDRTGGVRCRRAGHVVYESITAHLAAVTIRIEAVARSADGDTNLVPQSGARRGGVLLARIEALTAGLHVQVVAFGPRHTVPPYDALRRLADFVSLNVVL